MSRLGKLPVKLNNGTTADLKSHVLTIKGPKGELKQAIHEQVNIEISVKNFSDETGVRLNLGIFDVYERLIIIERIAIDCNSGYTKYKATLPQIMLTPNKYKVSVAVDIPNIRVVEKLPEYLTFELLDLGTELGQRGDRENGIIYSNIKWEKERF